MPAMLNAAGFVSDMEKPADAGDGLTLRRGHVMVIAGWQADVAGPHLLAAHFPVTKAKDGSPITGRISGDFVFDDATSQKIALPYPAASLDPGAVTITVRQHTADAPQPLPAGSWRFDDERHLTVTRPASMDAGAIYRVTYTARDPIVAGLGFTVARDLLTFLRRGSPEQGNPLADLRARDPANGAFDTVIGFGPSQSGRYLRDFLYLGFNQGLDGRRVFDGVFSLIPGGRRTFTNYRFAEPGRFSRQHEDHDVPGFDFPFTYATLRDPVTGRTDGLLARCTESGTCPRIMQVDTSAEYWQAGASLVATGGTDHDVPLPDGVRAYMIAGAAHAPGMTMPACTLPPNPLNYAPAVRALMERLVDWTLGRRDPPPSRIPQLADGTLKPLDALAPPDLSAAGIMWPKVLNHPIPPADAPRNWPVEVPAVDADGLDSAGVHLPDVAVPNGTYLGWNLRRQGYAPGDLCLVFGSFVPFAKDAAARGGDPRRSMAERYPADTRAAKLREASDRLVQEGFLLPEDAAKVGGK
jgi:hypothetical protein